MNQKITNKTEKLTLLFSYLSLTDKHVELYEKLLAIPGARVARIAELVGFKRSTTYNLLKEMNQKGVLEEYKKGGVVYYRVAEPDSLTILVQKFQEDGKQAQQLLDSVMSDLKKEWRTGVGKPVIRYFEGEDGLREVFSDIYKPKDDAVYGCVDLEVVDKVFPEHVLADLIPLRVKNKLFAYSLVAESEQAETIKKDDKKQLRQTVLLDKDEYPLPAEIDVYGDKVAMLSFDKQQFIGMIIENTSFAQTVRSLFKRIIDLENGEK